MLANCVPGKLQALERRGFEDKKKKKKKGQLDFFLNQAVYGMLVNLKKKRAWHR